MTRIGINPLTWTNDDLPSLGGDTPLETCLSEARLAGYAGIELGNKFPRTAPVLGPILERHGLALVSGWYSGGLLERSVAEEIQAIDAHATLLSALGSSVLIYAETTGAVHGDRSSSLERRPVLSPPDRERFFHALTALAEHLSARGLRLAYHHHMGTVIQSEEDVDALMASTGDAVGLLLDTGHLTYAGADPVAVARRHGARIRHVHLKDVRRPVLERSRDRPFLDAVLEGIFTVPGDGSVDFRRVLSALFEARYRGWLVVEAEQDPAVAHPLTYAKLGYRTVSALASEVGLL